MRLSAALPAKVCQDFRGQGQPAIRESRTVARKVFYPISPLGPRRDTATSHIDAFAVPDGQGKGHDRRRRNGP